MGSVDRALVGDRALGGSFFPANFCWLRGLPHKPVGAFSVGWQILRALNDTEVEIEHRSAGISICVF